MSSVSKFFFGLLGVCLVAVSLEGMDRDGASCSGSDVREVAAGVTAISLKDQEELTTTDDRVIPDLEEQTVYVRRLCAVYVVQLLCTAYCVLCTKFRASHNVITLFPRTQEKDPSHCDSMRIALCYQFLRVGELMKSCQKRSLLSQDDGDRALQWLGCGSYNLLQVLQNISFVVTKENDPDCLQTEDHRLVKELDATSCYRDHSVIARKKCFDKDSVERLFSMTGKYCFRAVKARRRDFALRDEKTTDLEDGSLREEFIPMIVADEEALIGDRFKQLFGKWARAFFTVKWQPDSSQRLMIARAFTAIIRYEINNEAEGADELAELFRSCTRMVYELGFPAES